MITKIFLRTRLIYFLVISCFILFGRSFSGISVFSYRIGEWITALCLLLSIIFLFLGYKRFDQYFGIVKCRKKFDIPMKKIKCKYNDTSECLAEPFGYKYDF